MMKRCARLILPPLLAFCAAMPVSADDISFSLLQGLVDRSDLVIVATPEEVSGGGWGETVGQPGRMVDFTYMAPLLKIDRLVKSDGFSDKTLRINFSTRRFMGNLPVPDKMTNHVVTFNMADFAKDDKGLPGSPAKGVQYVFFLENGKKRHPESHFGAGTEELIYWSFDYDFGMIATTPEILAKLDRVLAEESHK